ncbi:peptidoglycan-binding protein [Rhodobacteraceae bacterium CCMM004]|nr:peptidoglycan-binding protein [Rhodobacteraceae bacterium CCMM004]
MTCCRSCSLAYLKRYGPRGPEVAQLQADLNFLGFFFGDKLKEDGIFGPNTERSVRAFQEVHELTVDGVVGPQTKKAIALAISRKITAGAVPPAPQAVPSAPAEDRPKPKTIKGEREAYTREEIEKIISENLDDPEMLHDPRYRYIFERWFGYAGKAMILPRLLAGIGVINTFAGVGMAVPPVAAIMGTIASLLAWNRALESAEAVYGYRGFAYGATWEVWSVRINSVTGKLYQEGFAPRESPLLKRKTLEFKAADKWPRYQATWDQGLIDANTWLHKNCPPNVPPLEFRLGMQMLGPDQTHTEFCKRVMRAQEPLIASRYPRQLEPWQDSIRFGNVYPV